MKDKAPTGAEPSNYTADDIATIRAARKWSTYDLAKYLGCNQSTAWRMENGGKISMQHRRLLDLLTAERWGDAA